jgi:hypothetical protein
MKSRFFNALLDLLFDIILRLLDETPGVPGSVPIAPPRAGDRRG